MNKKLILALVALVLANKTMINADSLTLKNNSTGSFHYRIKSTAFGKICGGWCHEDTGNGNKGTVSYCCNGSDTPNGVGTLQPGASVNINFDKDFKELFIYPTSGVGKGGEWYFNLEPSGLSKVGTASGGNTIYRTPTGQEFEERIGGFGGEAGKIWLSTLSYDDNGGDFKAY